MSIYKTGMKAECSEDGIWLDFRENTWLFLVRDSNWMPEERQRAAHADLTITFVQKGIVDAFLLEIYDCMETSDVPFCMKDADDVLLQSLKSLQEYSWEVVFADGSSKVIGVREGSFTAKESSILRKALSARMSEAYTSEDFDRAYEKLSKKYEPFELEPFALFAEKTGGKH